jgi:predicted RNA methylase
MNLLPKSFFLVLEDNILLKLAIRLPREVEDACAGVGVLGSAAAGNISSLYNVYIYSKAVQISKSNLSTPCS